MAKTYGFAGRAAFDRNTRAMRAAEAAAHTSTFLKAQPGYTPTAQPTRVHVYVVDEKIDDRRNAYPGLLIYRQTEATSPADDWDVLGEAAEDEDENCLVISVSGEVLKKGVRYEGQAVGMFEVASEEDPAGKEIPVVLVELADGSELARIVSGTADGNGYYDAYVQESTTFTDPVQRDGERIWVKAYGGDVTAGTHLATYLARLPDGVHGGRAVYGVVFASAPGCIDSLLGIDKDSCLYFTVLAGINKCANVPANGNLKELVFDETRGTGGADGRWVATSMFTTGDGDTELSLQVDPDDLLTVVGYLNSENVADRKMKNLGCVGSATLLVAYDPLYCTESWITTCALCETVPNSWTVDFAVLGGTDTFLDGLYIIPYDVDCHWRGPGPEEEQIGELLLDYDEGDPDVYNVLTLVLNDKIIVYKYRGEMCCGPKTFSYDAELSDSGITDPDNIPPTVTVNALGPCGAGGCAKSYFSALIECQSCATIMCEEVGPIPRKMCLTLPDMPDRPDPVEGSYYCSPFYGVTFEPVELVFGADFLPGWATPGVWFPIVSNAFGTVVAGSSAPAKSGNLRSWVGTGNMTHPTLGAFKYGVEMHMADDDCTVTVRYWIPYICVPSSNPVAYLWTPGVGEHEENIDPADLPPLGAFPVTLVGVSLPYWTSAGTPGDPCDPEELTACPGGGLGIIDVGASATLASGPCPPSPPSPPPPPDGPAPPMLMGPVPVSETNPVLAKRRRATPRVKTTPIPLDMARTPCKHEGDIIEPCSSSFGARADLRHVRECDLYGKCTRGPAGKVEKMCVNCTDYVPDPTLTGGKK